MKNKVTKVAKVIKVTKNNAKLSNIKGFTLLELTAVIGVLAIISATVWVGTGQSYRRDIRLAADLLAADIRHAQQLAIQKGTNTSVWIFREGYFIFYYPRGASGQMLGDFRPFLNATGGGGLNIRFTPRGTTSTPMTINLRNNRYRISLTLTLGAGRVLIQEPVPLVR